MPQRAFAGMRLSQLCRALLLIPLVASGAMAQDATVEDVPLPKARPVSTTTPPLPADPKPAENTTPGSPCHASARTPML